MTTIRITPALLNQVATRHDGVADEIAVARRDAAFAQHEAAHRAAADNLRSIAVRFSDQEEINAAELRLD